MSTHDVGRRMQVVVTFAQAKHVPRVNGRPLYEFGAFVQLHVRALLLNAHWQADTARVAWSWREPRSATEIGKSELVRVRARLREALLTFEDLADRAEDAGAGGNAGVAEYMAEVLRQLAARDDPTLRAYACVTAQGVQLHSWGLPVPGRPSTAEEAELEIAGVVTVSQSPGPDIQVVLEDATHHTVIARTRSDGRGGFRFSGLASGRYRLRGVSDRVDFPVTGVSVALDRTSVTGIELRSSASSRNRPAASDERGESKTERSPDVVPGGSESPPSVAGSTSSMDRVAPTSRGASQKRRKRSLGLWLGTGVILVGIAGWRVWPSSADPSDEASGVRAVSESRPAGERAGPLAGSLHPVPEGRPAGGDKPELPPPTEGARAIHVAVGDESGDRFFSRPTPRVKSASSRIAPETGDVPAQEGFSGTPPTANQREDTPSTVRARSRAKADGLPTDPPGQPLPEHAPPEDPKGKPVSGETAPATRASIRGVAPAPGANGGSAAQPRPGERVSHDHPAQTAGTNLPADLDAEAAIPTPSAAPRGPNPQGDRSRPVEGGESPDASVSLQDGGQPAADVPPHAAAAPQSSSSPDAGTDPATEERAGRVAVTNPGTAAASASSEEPTSSGAPVKQSERQPAASAGGGGLEAPDPGDQAGTAEPSTGLGPWMPVWLSLRVGPWAPELQRDVILETRPVAENREKTNVPALRFAVLDELKKQLPPAFRRPAGRVGFRLAPFAGAGVDTLRWHRHSPAIQTGIQILDDTTVTGPLFGSAWRMEVRRGSEGERAGEIEVSANGEIIIRGNQLALEAILFEIAYPPEQRFAWSIEGLAPTADLVRPSDHPGRIELDVARLSDQAGQTLRVVAQDSAGTWSLTLPVQVRPRAR